VLWSLAVACVRIVKDGTETGVEPDVTVAPPPTDTPTTVAESGRPHSASTASTGADTHTGPQVPGFTATVYQDVGGSLRPALGVFDDAGCFIAGSAVPVSSSVAQVVDTPSGRWFAVGDHELGEVDPVTGGFSLIPVGGGHTGGAGLSWSMSITVDPANGEVLAATLGGLGELVAYDPATSVVTQRGDLDNRDVVAVAALGTGQLAALEHPGSGNAVGRLLAFDPATGAYLGGVALAAPLPQPEPSPSVRDPRRTWQLRDTSLGLVAVVRSTTHPPADTFLLDSSGNVTPIVCP
jgi:hypothetical protein